MENPFKTQEAFEDTLYDIGQAVERELAMLSTEDIDEAEREQIAYIQRWSKTDEGRA